MAARGGTETPGVNAPIFEGHNDANDRFPACEKGTIHPETTGGHCKKKTKGGSSRRIKEGDVVSCASTEFDGDQPGSWSDGKKDRTHGVVTHISKEGIVMVHWYDDNTNFAVKMKNLRREAEKAPEAMSRSPTTVSNEKSATTNRPNADFANDKERQAGRGRKRDRSGRNQSGRKQDPRAVLRDTAVVLAIVRMPVLPLALLFAVLCSALACARTACCWGALLRRTAPCCSSPVVAQRAVQ
jgi:hypothetical protein